MTHHAVSWRNISCLWGTVVTVGTIPMPQSCMQGVDYMAGKAVISNVVVGERCGGGCGSCLTLSVAGKTLSTHIWIMIIGQITLTRVSKGMTYNTVSGFYRSSMPMTLNAIRMSWIIM